MSYPNPANEGINIRHSNYRLINSNGMVVAEGNDSFINTKDFSDGIYYLVINNNVETIIVKH